jgi:hypothetical protein
MLLCGLSDPVFATEIAPAETVETEIAPAETVEIAATPLLVLKARDLSAAAL